MLYNYKKDLDKNIFRGYDIRGVYPTALDEDTAYTFGLGFGTHILALGKQICVVGHDNRLSSPSLLKYLLEHENWVIDRDTLLNRIWGYDYFGTDRVVDNHIKKLRKALGESGTQIKTVIGRGYKLTK